MKALKLILLFLLSVTSFAQNNWQERMFEKDENFNSIVDDFNIYKSLHLKDGYKIPKGLGIKQFERWRYYWQGRVDANGNFPREGSVLNEIEKYKQHQTSTRYASGAGTWELLGPIAKPNNGSGQPNGNGRLTCSAFHPTEPNIIYIGSPAGGLWKSTDAGLTWTEYSSGLIRLGISSIAVNQLNPDVIYIGTGDRDAGDTPGYGVWKSVDGGANWTAQNNGMGNRTVYEVLVDPSNPNNLIASTSGSRIYRSTDAGANWTYTTTSSSMKDISFKPGDPNTIYAAGTSFDVSTNGGVSFNQITNGVPTGAARIAIAVSANQPNYVYVIAGNGSGLIGIYRSTDSGVTFTTRTTSPNVLGYDITGGTGSQAWYDLVIAADPTNADIIYTGGVNIWKSIDGGTTMTCVAHWTGSGGIDDVHADQHSLDFSPHTNNLFSGNDGGVYVTSDGGVVWNELSNGLAIAQVYKIGVSQTVSDLVINGYQDNGTSISRGTSFSTEIGGDGMECIIDPTNENYMYGALYYGDIRRSTNGGTTFGSISGAITEQGGWVTPYKLDPNNANTMFAGYANVWRNTAVRTGTAWTSISSFGGTSTMVDLAIASSDSNVMYVSRNGTNKFYSSSNALAISPTWTDLTGSLPTSSTPKDIEIDPTDPAHLFMALGNDIYESTNSGVNWTNFSGTLPNISLNTIVIDKDSPIKAMYVGMDVGVYYRDNTMADWIPFSTGLSNVEITELEIHYNNMECKSNIYAATYGQGLWKGDLKDPGNLAPKACFYANTTNGCVGNTFTLTDNSDFTPTSWAWSISPATFVYVNSTSSTSQNPQIQFSSSGPYTVALTATNSTGSDVKTNPSYIQVEGGSNAIAFSDNFESTALCGTASDCGTTVCSLGGLWSNLTNGTEDNIDWRIDENGTPSTGTGPSVDFNPGTATGNYAYIEASSCSVQTAILESQCVLLDDQYDFVFAYHMYGTSIGSLHLDLFVNGSWVEDFVPALSGDKGNTWLISTTPLYIYQGQTVKLRIRGITGNGFASDIAIDDLKFVPKCSSSTTWGGIAWSNGTPSLTKTAIISGNYVSSGDLNACSITITNNSQVTFNAGHTLIVDGNVTVDAGSTLSIENNAALRQVNDAATNSGTIFVKRDATTMNRLDYTAWSSPVIGQQLQSFSPNTVSTRFYEYLYTGTTTPTAYQSLDATSSFPAGKGIMIRSDNTYTGPTVFNGQFSGVPTNGVINQSIGIGYNLLGNPFASPLDAKTFLADNPSIGTLYFWTNTTPASGGVYPTNNFAAYTSGAGGVAAFNSGKVPNGTIQTGQGFYIQTSLASNANFSNKQRVNASVSTQFFKNASAQNLLERHRIWLNLNDINTPYNQMLLGYIEGATDNVDHGIDGKVLSDSKAMLYNLLNDEAYVIQGKSLPFSDDDVVVLGLKIITAGTYNITLDTVDGLFDSQDIFIKDKFTNIIHDIKQSAYVFNSQDGIFEDRFEVVYKSGSLSNIDFETDHSVLIFSNESGININASSRIKEIVVFDVLGRTLFESKAIGKKEIIINLMPNSQALLIKVQFENDLITTKKIIH